MAQGHPSAHGGVRDGHHAIAAAGVVFPQVPAESVEVGELPAVEETTQHQRTWRGVGRGVNSLMMLVGKATDSAGLLTHFVKL